MKVVVFRGRTGIYCCNVYLVLGDYNQPGNVNSLVDTGSIDFSQDLLAALEKMPAGIGKRTVEQIVLTHDHFDHAGGLRGIVERYQPSVFAYGPQRAGIQRVFNHQVLRMGDQDFKVMHAPGHSDDSICLYCRKEGVIFSGDTPLVIRTRNGCYPASYLKTLEDLAGLDIKVAYPGHDNPRNSKVRETILTTLENVRGSRIIP